MSHFCFGRGYPNTPGVSRGGCLGRCPGIRMKVVGYVGNLEPHFPSRIFEYVGTQPASGPYGLVSTWIPVISGVPHAVYPQLRKCYTGIALGIIGWRWELEIKDHADSTNGAVFAWGYEEGFNCHLAQTVVYNQHYGDLPEPDVMGIVIEPVPYSELDPDFCTPRL